MNSTVADDRAHTPLEEVEKLDAEFESIDPESIAGRYRTIAIRFAAKIEELEAASTSDSGQSPIERIMADLKRKVRKPVGALLAKGMPTKISRAVREVTINGVEVKMFLRWKVSVCERPITIVFYAIPNSDSTNAEIVCGFADGHESVECVVECNWHKAANVHESTIDSDISLILNKAAERRASPSQSS